MSKPLPGVGTVISDTWKFFTTTWNTSVKTSRLLILAGLVTFASGLLVMVNENFLILDALLAIAVGVFVSWVMIRLSLVMLDLEAGKQPDSPQDNSRKAWSFFWSFLWISILTSLVVLGASLLLILPGIYFGVALNFSQFILLDKGTRGSQALAASRALVKDRWWATFGRLFVGGLVFGGGVALIVGLLVSGLVVLMMNRGIGPDNSVANGAIQLLWMIVYAAIAPLLIGFQVKVYRALEKTR